jgi:hypothetical protein
MEAPVPHQPEAPKNHETASDSSVQDRLWTVQDLIRYIGCSERELRTMRHAGLPTIRFRRLIRFDPELVKQWLRECCAG